MKKILFASNNPGKLKEVKEILSPLGFEVLSPKQAFANPIEVAETGKTFSQNANLKAKAMGDKSGLITLADDSGLSIDYLNGGPGVYSARYESTDEKRNQKVLKKLDGVSQIQRDAKFICAICLYNPNTKEHHIAIGEVLGSITTEPIGHNGFGYDPIFYSHELEKTFGQANQEEKNQISHRRRALEKIKKYL